ncbi:MAG: LysR family transcriptional regulator [Pseudomonadota bacterium]
MDRLSSMNVFARVVATGGFSAAARELRLTPAAVSKQIAGLEAWLGVRLFARTTRRLRLTEAGTAFHARVVHIAEAVEEARAEAGALQQAPRGHLRISAPLSFGVLHLGRLFADFLQAHPNVSASIELTDRKVDLIEEGYDLAVRIGELPDSSLHARKLAQDSFVLCAAPAYLQAHEPPQVPADLSRHDCLVYDGAPADWLFEGPAGLEAVRVEGRLHANNGLMLMAAAIAGHGIAYAPAFIAAPLLASGQLLPLMPRYRPRTTGIYAVFPGGRRVPAKVRALVDCLAAALARPAWQEAP